MTDSWPVPRHQSLSLEITNFVEFPKKFKLLDKRMFELVEKRRADSLPSCGHPPLIN